MNVFGDVLVDGSVRVQEGGETRLIVPGAGRSDLNDLLIARSGSLQVEVNVARRHGC